MSWDRYEFAPYVSVAEKRRRAEKEAAKLAKKSGAELNPVRIEGRKIASTFWGKAWCDNLESYSDYEYRLPRGRSYVRNGCVVDLKISECAVDAYVSGTALYKVKIRIDPVDPAVWKDLKKECAGQIGSLIDLLQGKLSGAVMEIMTRKGTGLFPAPSEIQLKCSCPDSATMCKHVAAVLYGVGARLDEHPELLFVLREADQKELITQAAGSLAVAPGADGGSGDVLADDDLASVFGIDLDAGSEMETSKVAETSPAKGTSRKKVKTPSAKAGKQAVTKAVAKPAIASKEPAPKGKAKVSVSEAPKPTVKKAPAKSSASSKAGSKAAKTKRAS